MSDDPTLESIVSRPAPWVQLKGKLQLWLKAFLNDSNPSTFMNKAGSAKEAGYCCQDNQSFANVGSQNYIKLQTRIELWMDDHGLTTTTNKKKLLQLSEAEETKLITVDGKVEAESLPDNFTIVTETVQEKFNKNGDKIKEYKTVIAYNLAANETQRRTTDMMIKVLGQYAVEKIDVTLDENLIKLMSQGRQRAKEADDG